MPAALLLLALIQEGQVAAGQDRHSALRIEVSGRIDLDHAYRGGAVNEAGAALNGAAPTQSSSSFWSGRVALRADLTLRDSVSGAVEIENRSYDEGLNRPFGADPEGDDLDLKQAWIEAGEFLSPKLSLRLGVQGLALRNRPHGEAFFLDLGESEGFFEGGAGGFVRNTVDRDVREAVGARMSWSPVEIATVQGFAAVVGEGGDTSSDESVYALTLNAAIPDDLAFWLLFAVVSGGDPDLGQVGTLGAGIDLYVGAGRAWELFAEGYGQGGELSDAGGREISKRAFAGQAGLRAVGLFCDCLQAEAAFAFRSGDRSATDRRDGAFQSYENENRFLILQSAEFGLDVDTNVRLLRAGLGVGPFELAGKPLRFQIDAGQFRADERLRDAAGAVAARGEDDWGLEVDARLVWEFNASLTFRVQGAWLLGSSLLEEFTSGPDDAAMGLFSADLKF